ncbi:hypothetical protein HWB57_gp142 [Erwinia phage vB_EamM-Bue1]|uniref:Uncharacterized protein n=1 Tax=Erwinia phage vB_EamM-Bue1 TaxID=2099338 RepID=A0A2P1JUF6_9CAUD|nr:hypothetical protein HWB57_gp142 [Erwinia phage vB_EamM-Bue1]AVO22979.1 hypothetical protein [Erwinia phage vB_EamM-Bue1]
MTADGRPVRFIARDAKIGGGSFDLVALITEPDGNEFIEWYESSKAYVEGHEWVIPCDAGAERTVRFS